MHLVLRRFNRLGGASNDLNLQDNFQDNTYVHPALVPLMKGDWLVSGVTCVVWDVGLFMCLLVQ